MTSRPLVWKGGSLILAAALLLWVQSGVAVPVSAGSVQCRALMQHMHRATTAAMPTTVSGCCPRHASLKPNAATLPPTQRPDCCTLGNPPARPAAFLIARGAPTELGTHVSSRPEPIPLPPDAGVWLGESPPFRQLRSEMKISLRI